jgi:hypothetical protein
MAKVQEILKNAYNHLGNISTDELQPHVLLTNLQSVIDKRMMDLSLADTNHLLQSWELTVDGVNTDFELPVPDFGEAVRMEVSQDGQTFYGNVEFVNHASLFLNRGEGKLTVATYGDPPHIEFSLVPDAQTIFKLWYEPSKGTPLRLAQEPALNAFFHAFLALEAAYMSLPDVRREGMDPQAESAWKSMKQGVFMQQLQDWEQRWLMWIRKPENQSVVKKRRFNERRSRRRVPFTY